MKNTKSSGPKKIEISILVPVYNEEATIQNILKRVTNLPISRYEVLVVDDASNDRSKDIIELFATKFKKSSVALKVFSHSRNRGKGAGIKTGLEHAKGEYFIIQDADLEYDPADITSVLRKGQGQGLDAVYGSRFMGHISNMPRANYYANRFYNYALRRLYRTNITDMHTCYKMVRTDVLKGLHMQSEGFGYATELVSKLLKRGITISEVPINFNGRTKQEGKKIGYIDGLDCLYMLCRYKMNEKL
jgi:glycosyltransferase involved in cell wall biosynthesis